MAALEDELRRLAAANAEEEASKANEAQETDAHKKRLIAARLEKLHANEEVQWFLNTHFRPLVDKENSQALDVKRTADERNDSAQRHDIANTLLNLLETETLAARQAALDAFQNGAK